MDLYFVQIRFACVVNPPIVLPKQAHNAEKIRLIHFHSFHQDVLLFNYAYLQNTEPEKTTDLRCDGPRDLAELDGLLTAAPLHVAPPVHRLLAVAVIKAGAEGEEGLPGVRVLDRQGEHLCAGVAVTGLVVHVALGGAAEELVRADQE